MEVLRFFLSVVTLAALAPVAIYCLEVIAGCWPRRERSKAAAKELRPRLAVLVPAHNEASGLAETIRSIKPQLAKRDRLIVVADNCTDRTAEVAREAGASVLERVDAMRRGKGFALAFGLDTLFADPPEVVLFFDADCRIGEGTIEHLAIATKRTQRPAQALNLCEPTARGGSQQILSGLAFRFKNLIRMTGIARLGGPCHLTGTGMALPWKLVDKVAWATGNVVEDMQLGIDLTLAGYPPLFVPEARVMSSLPQSNAGVMAQRRRWEHGFLATALSEAPLLMGQAFERRSWALLVLAMDFLVPPLSLLSLMLVAGWFATLSAWAIGLGVGPLVLVSLAILALAGTTLLGWSTHCRDLTEGSIFLRVPAYVLAKIPMYAAFFNRRQQEWNRAERKAT